MTTIQSIIDMLKTDGVNSKKKVIDFLNNLDLIQLRELRNDITIKINEKEAS